MRAWLWPWLVGGLVLAIFGLVSLRHLDSVPQVYEDEPWQASSAYKLLTQGVFGSDLFAGFHGMDQRYYGFMPLHPLLLAVTFRVLGVGLEQARLETVALSATTLALTFALGVRLFKNAWVGAVAVAVLVLVRWTGLTYVQLSGIPLVDFARLARYDPLVPVLGLAALHVYLLARTSRLGGSETDSDGSPPLATSAPGPMAAAQRPAGGPAVAIAALRGSLLTHSSVGAPWLFGAAGALGGLAGLAHVYGLFWVPALLLLAAWDRQPRRVLAALAVGALLPWLPYAAYVLADLADWRGQTAIYASRFELLNPRWYAQNVLGEYHRYGPGLGPIGINWLLRPGFAFVLIALPLALFGLVRRASRCDPSARAIVVPALLFPALFALTITLKLVNYTLIELPLFALAIAWGVCSTWSRLPRLRPVLAVVGAAVLLESGVALVQLDQAAATTTPYPSFIAEIRAYLPEGARVLGLHSYWLGLQDFEYRSFLLPLNWSDEGVPLDDALSRVAPDVVLLDARMRAYFDSLSTAENGDRARFYGWLSAHSVQLVGRVDDPTYGLTEIYRVSR